MQEKLKKNKRERKSFFMPRVNQNNYHIALVTRLNS